jgi:hypothetical protein
MVATKTFVSIFRENHFHIFTKKIETKPKSHKLSHTFSRDSWQKQFLKFSLNFLQGKTCQQHVKKETFSRKWKCFDDIRENV